MAARMAAECAGLVRLPVEARLPILATWAQ
jgi:hypothetical protein